MTRSLAVLAGLLVGVLGWISTANADEPPAGDTRTPAASPAETQLGRAGESCRARADCLPDLRCIDQVCTRDMRGQPCEASADCGGLRCVRNVCVRSRNKPAPAREDPGPSTEASPESWSEFRLRGAHPFVGFTWLGGPSLQGRSGNGLSAWGSAPEGAALFAIRGGVFVGATEIAVAISPVTYFYYRGIPGPAFQATGTLGPFLALYEGAHAQLYWPIRIGVGVVAVNTIPRDSAYFQAVFEGFGLAIKAGHLMIDLNLPSFRYAVTPQETYVGHAFSWLFGGSLSYVF